MEMKRKMSKEKLAYLVVGCLASGKTFISKLLFPDLEYISPDLFMTGKWTPQKNEIAWDKAHNLVRKCIKEGKNFVLDSPKAGLKSRRKIIEIIHQESKEYKIVVIYVKSSLKDCLIRNAQRGEHKEPEEQIRQYYKSIEGCPFSKEQGFDYVIPIDNSIQEFGGKRGY